MPPILSAALPAQSRPGSITTSKPDSRESLTISRAELEREASLASPGLLEVARELGRAAARREFARSRGLGLIETALALAVMSILLATAMLILAPAR